MNNYLVIRKFLVMLRYIDTQYLFYIHEFFSIIIIELIILSLKRIYFLKDFKKY